MITLKPGPMVLAAKRMETRLREVFPERQFTMDWVPAVPSTDQWDQLLRRPPVIALCWARFSPAKGTGARMLKGDTDFSVICVTANESGMRARLLGDTLGPGAMTLAQVTAAVLHGHTFSGIGSMQVTDVSHGALENFERANLGIAVVSVSINQSMSLSEVLDGVDPDRFETLSITWSFDGGVTPAGTDTIHLGDS